MNKISPVQKQLREKITAYINEMKENRTSLPPLILIGIVFIYGLIHAAGPGHGKFVSIAYFLSNKSNVRKGLLLGIMIAFLQIGSAVLVVTVLNVIIKKALLIAVEDANRTLQLISYALISLMGMFLFLRLIYSNQQESKKRVSGINIFPLALSVGIAPCPSAVILLLFSLSIDMLATGIVLLLFMAAGMAVTISFIGVATIFSRKNIEKIFSENENINEKLQTYAGLLGSVIIILLGSIMFAINL